MIQVCRGFGAKIDDKKILLTSRYWKDKIDFYRIFVDSLYFILYLKARTRVTGPLY